MTKATCCASSALRAAMLRDASSRPCAASGTCDARSAGASSGLSARAGGLGSRLAGAAYAVARPSGVARVMPSSSVSMRPRSLTSRCLLLAPAVDALSDAAQAY
jgi:hypothetical protein